MHISGDTGRHPFGTDRRRRIQGALSRPRSARLESEAPRARPFLRGEQSRLLRRSLPVRASEPRLIVYAASISAIDRSGVIDGWNRELPFIPACSTWYE